MAEKTAWIKSSSPQSSLAALASSSCWLLRCCYSVLHTPTRAVQQSHLSPTYRAVVRPAAASTSARRGIKVVKVFKVAVSRSRKHLSRSCTRMRLARGAHLPRSNSNQVISLTPP